MLEFCRFLELLIENYVNSDWASPEGIIAIARRMQLNKPQSAVISRFLTRWPKMSRNSRKAQLRLYRNSLLLWSALFVLQYASSLLQYIELGFSDSMKKIHLSHSDSWNFLLYSLTTLGSGIISSVFNFYFVYFFLDVYGVSVWCFQFSQVIFLVWNAINDPLFGWFQVSDFALKACFPDHCYLSDVSIFVCCQFFITLLNPLILILLTDSTRFSWCWIDDCVCYKDSEQ